MKFITAISLLIYYYCLLFSIDFDWDYFSHLFFAKSRSTHGTWKIIIITEIDFLKNLSQNLFFLRLLNIVLIQE